MKKTLAALALAATTALSTGALAEDITEFRIGILGGENAQDRMNNYKCLPTTRPKRLASKPRFSPRPTTTA
jgi:ABC-type phosphate/phosphonate transport system substrate-binding protein